MRRVPICWFQLSVGTYVGSGGVNPEDCVRWPVAACSFRLESNLHGWTMVKKN